jgi:hypothetical protein
MDSKSFLKKIYVLTVVGVMPIVAGILEIVGRNILDGVCLLIMGVANFVLLYRKL